MPSFFLHARGNANTHAPLLSWWTSINNNVHEDLHLLLAVHFPHQTKIYANFPPVISNSFGGSDDLRDRSVVGSGGVLSLLIPVPPVPAPTADADGVGKPLSAVPRPLTLDSVWCGVPGESGRGFGGNRTGKD